MVIVGIEEYEQHHISTPVTLKQLYVVASTPIRHWKEFKVSDLTEMQCPYFRTSHATL